MTSGFKKIILLSGDLASLFLALSLVLLSRYPRAAFNEQLQKHLWPFLLVFIFWLIAIYISGLYDLNLKARSRRFLKAIMSAAAVASLISITYFYLNVASSVAPRTNLALFIAFFLGLFFIWRYLYQTIQRAVPGVGLAIMGNNEKSRALQSELNKNPGAGYRLEIIIPDESELEKLKNQVEGEKVKIVVVCDDFGSAKTTDSLLKLLQNRISVYSYPDFYELLSGKIPVEEISANWFLENLRENQRGYFNLLKRIMDFIGALTVLIISLIFWPLIALIIKLESRGPIFFRQPRLGRQGKLFTIIKFRTMRETGNDRALTIDGDKRITAFGNFLRKTRLDEIPQMINILKGEMSFIGPRPERPELAQALEQKISFYNTRLIVKPGLSGWDQISGEYHSPTEEDTLKKLQNDLFYIKNRSLFLDLAIIMKTVATIISRGGK
ncbi:MAG: sugar transferase [Patescibacteria group bacterium]|jgi:exopolysaccharide biosynthesis polyprenyl glycosylphosphotransferase